MPTRARLAAVPAAVLAAAPVLLGGCASSPSHAPSGRQRPAPSAAARMVCSDETQSDIAAVLGLPSAPSGKATWHAPHYMCMYSLPMGTLVLSVHEGASASAAATYAADLRRQLRAAIAPGLSAQSYRTGDGKVIVLKDNDVLQVDATGLPEEFGTQHQKRTDFAYEIASDILGCWTGDHS